MTSWKDLNAELIEAVGSKAPNQGIALILINFHQTLVSKAIGGLLSLLCFVTLNVLSALSMLITHGMGWPSLADVFAP